MRNRYAACALYLLVFASPGSLRHLFRPHAAIPARAAALLGVQRPRMRAGPGHAEQGRDANDASSTGSSVHRIRPCGILLGTGDVVVISGGSNAGLQAGQRYFVRRHIIAKHEPASSRRFTPPDGFRFSVWIRRVATATVLHACDGILLDDYLEPFTPPMIALDPLPGTTPHYDNMGHIMTGTDGRQTAGGSSQLMTIDRGTMPGVVVGQRFLVFRDKRAQRVETTGRSKVFATMDGNVAACRDRRGSGRRCASR